MAKPLFRKVIFPWYYAKGVQALVIVAGLALMVFAIVGITVALQYEPAHIYLWPPALLFVLAAVMVGVSALRLKRAFTRKPSKFIDSDN